LEVLRAARSLDGIVVPLDPGWGRLEAHLSLQVAGISAARARFQAVRVSRVAAVLRTRPM
jgi:hypothetical protein